jgi:carbamoyl-phosphate synthase large subunit
MMKKRIATPFPRRVLILGSGALQIGQAGEFDYSGSQAIKALKEENVATVLINPNIATIQTDTGMADETYFLPVDPYFVEQILIKEQCDALLLSFGGQTALNCGLKLEESGVLERLNVKVLGTPVSTIRNTEDRHLFVQRLREIAVVTARSEAVTDVATAVAAANRIGYPVMMRSGFSLGGKGSSFAYNDAEVHAIAEMAFASVPQILVEECLAGWKELEYEVVRDGADNCITVCNMENVDPMGIHTGESIVVAPSQTLDDYEYQMLRDIAIKTIRHLGVVGECNIQFALNPANREYRVIEVNARLSRSSALASKATGYPLAYVAAKIALGYTLPEIRNLVTKVTTAFFEPALDYIVCKFPRWDLQKFEGADLRLGSEMKSVGEVMAIGRSFPEVLQKAIRMLEVGANGLDPDAFAFADLHKELAHATPHRMFAIAKAFNEGMSVDEVADITQIDRFFLSEIYRTVSLQKELVTKSSLEAKFVTTLKKAGFCDKQIARVRGCEESAVRNFRRAHGIRPYLAQIDTLAAEYPAETNFLYFTYAAQKSDIETTARKSVLVLGSGCYRIGSSVEFDWCAVSSVKAAREAGYETIMINCNPETVSTDYDTCDRLVFDEVSLETVLELVDFEKPEGLIVSMGGQTPNNLAVKLHEAGVRLIGTSAESIDVAENRSRFSKLLDSLFIAQPKWGVAKDSSELAATVTSIGGYPVLVRPSYVLSGAAMRVASTETELSGFLMRASTLNTDHPVVISKFEMDAREVELDGVACGGELRLYALTEHIEDAGVHSGDATLVIPPQRLPFDVMREIIDIGRLLAKSLHITGPFNLQTLVTNHEVKVIELNLRASRSFPLISKTLGVNFIREATKVMLDASAQIAPQPSLFDRDYVVVKAPQFSFSRIKGADPRLSVEMGSTGEVACFGRSTEEALLKASMATGFKRPQHGVCIFIEDDSHRSEFVREANMLRELGLPIFAHGKTFESLARGGVDCREIADAETFMKRVKNHEIDWVICVPGASRAHPDKLGYEMRRSAIDLALSLTTDLWVARRLVKALARYPTDALKIEPWSHYLQAHA